jgi:hypothetical protein
LLPVLCASPVLLSRVEQIFELVDVVWTNQHIVAGLSSGEGLIHAVRDPGDRRDKQLLVVGDA